MSSTKRLVLKILLATGLTMLPALAADGQAKHEAQTGTAAYYSHVFNGRRTSDRGTFSSHHMTAASATLPLGTRVRVTNLTNNKSVVVTITDRYADKNRLIDVSRGAAVKLGFIHAGTAQVRVEPL